jgi:hypothetical protein
MSCSEKVDDLSRRGTPESVERSDRDLTYPIDTTSTIESILIVRRYMKAASASKMMLERTS